VGVDGTGAQRQQNRHETHEAHEEHAYCLPAGF